MKAIVYTKYGPPEVLQLKEVEKPTPMDNEVLVKVRAAAANAGDWHLLRGSPFLMRLMGFGLLKPKNKILGADDLFPGVLKGFQHNPFIRHLGPNRNLILISSLYKTLQGC